MSWQNTSATNWKWCCICRHHGTAPDPGANQQDFKHFLSLPVPVRSPGVRVQSGMEEEEDAEEQDCVFTVSVRSGFFPWKPALWLLFMATWQAKTSLFTMGPVIPKSRAWVVDSSFEWNNDFYELLQIILKHFLEFKNVPSYFSIHNQSVLFCSLGERLYEDICYLALRFFSQSQKKGCRKKTRWQKGK